MLHTHTTRMRMRTLEFFGKILEKDAKDSASHWTILSQYTSNLMTHALQTNVSRCLVYLEHD